MHGGHGDVLTSDNAVSLLVNGIYFRYPEYEQIPLVDQFFEVAAKTILDTVKSGKFDMKKMFSAITNSVNAGSIMVWSSHPDEQALLDGSRLQGVLPSDNQKATVMGVFYRDISESKIDYYLDTSTATTSDYCTNTEAPTFTTTVTLHSRVTPEIGATLPFYVHSSHYGSAYFVTQVFAYGPVGSTIADLPIGTAWTVRQGTDLGRPVAIWEVPLAQGETRDFTVTFTGAPGTYGPLQVRGTPMINKTAVTIDPAQCR